MVCNEHFSKNEELINEAHRAYSDFIYHTAWYEFEFLPWVGKVWSAEDHGKASFLRKWERVFLFTAEFSTKAAYAKLIEMGAQMSYDEPVTSIYMTVSLDSNLRESQDLKIVASNEEKMILGITRWGAFTRTMLEIKDSEMEIYDIGGNDDIVVSIKAPISNDKLNEGQLLYTSGIVTSSELERRVFRVHVNRLLPFIRLAHTNNVEVEHIFDY